MVCSYCINGAVIVILSQKFDTLVFHHRVHGFTAHFLVELGATGITDLPAQDDGIEAVKIDQPLWVCTRRAHRALRIRAANHSILAITALIRPVAPAFHGPS